MNKNELEKFILVARTKTYAGAINKAIATLPGSRQYEYCEGDYSYRDIYYMGNGLFPGIEVVYFKEKPVWSMTYFGDFSKMTEERADQTLRQALIDLWDETRINNYVEKDYGDYKYICDGSGTIDQLKGRESILIDDREVYFFDFQGGFIYQNL